MNRGRPDCKRGIREENGASEGIRTLDIHVGNVTLYQTELRSLPSAYDITRSPPFCKPHLFLKNGGLHRMAGSGALPT